MGVLDVDAMLEGMSARSLNEWAAYAGLEPWGEDRADLRAGIVAATIANVHRRKGRAYSAKDFMPRFGPRRRQSAEEINSVLIAAMMAAGGMHGDHS
jgi:hypothetical protein